MDHTVVHFEISAADVYKLKTFYEALFEWKILKASMEVNEYRLVQTVPTYDKGMPLNSGVNGKYLFQRQTQHE
jgi:predicted enzyme related to lactoylglutathione lyase